jgi:addiction module RelB/DinJ family antitoxin
MASAIVQARVDERIKSGAESVLAGLGLSLSDGIRISLNHINKTGSLAFALGHPIPPATEKINPDSVWHAHNTSSHIPNAETARAIDEAKHGIGLTSFDSVEEFMNDLGK